MRSFVVEGDHAKAKSQSAADNRKNKKYLFGDSAKAAFGTEFVYSAKCKNCGGDKKRYRKNDDRQKFQQYPLR